MSYFAQVIDTKVVKVVSIEQDTIDTGVFGDPSTWIQTSYNTRGGVHSEGGTPLRKNYAGVGFTYDRTKDAFISPQPYASWTLNEDTCLWNPPTAYPDEGLRYVWNEETLSWVEVVS